VLVGTTDTERDQPELEPRALPEEIDFILRNAARYLARDPERDDVLSVFAGLRPLVHKGGTDASSKTISRSHEVVVSESGLVSIMGGKWTTYRKMAEDAMAHAIFIGGLDERPCVTEALRLHGWMDRDDPDLPEGHVRRFYGSDAPALDALARERPELGEPLHPRLSYRGAEVLWGARHALPVPGRAGVDRGGPRRGAPAGRRARPFRRVGRRRGRELHRARQGLPPGWNSLSGPRGPAPRPCRIAVPAGPGNPGART
jgi:glycerol-3-phosphate dehydrogenase